MKKLVSYLIIFALFITMLPVTSFAQETGQRYSNEQMESIVQKYENNEDMLNAIFCDDTYIGYWAVINDIKQNIVLTWALDTSSKLIDEYPEKQDYAEILANLITMQSGELAEQIETQSRFDDLKNIGDYAWDVVEIATGFVGASGALKTISTAISTGVEGISDVIIQNNDQAKYYEATLQDYSQSFAFLSAISQYAENEELRNVASSLLSANDTLLVKRLEYLADASGNIVEYEAKFFVENMSMELLKEADLYATDETVKWFVDEGINLKNVLLAAKDAAEAAFKITILAGDIGFGTSDVYNRYQEMKVVADVASSLVKANEATSIPLQTSETKLEAIQGKCNYYKALLVTHARGEYLLYQLLMNDAGAVSDIRWIIEYFKNPEDTTDAWYEAQIELLMRYCDVLDNIFVPEQLIEILVDTNSLVSDAYSDSIVNAEMVYCYHIPQFNLNGNLAQQVNKTIYDQCYSILDRDVYDHMDEYGYPAIGSMWYGWGYQGDFVSIVIRTEPTMYYGSEYNIYTISNSTGQEVSMDELLASYGMDREGFYALVRSRLKQYWDEMCDMREDVGAEFFDDRVTKTLADSNIYDSIPFINPTGGLSFVANIYSVAGGDCYLDLINASGPFDMESLECSQDHSADDAEPTGDVLQYFIANCDLLYFTEADIRDFDDEMCMYARNAIFAKSGRKFQSQKLQDYFRKYSWYAPSVEPDAFTVDMLNRKQLANLELIQDREQTLEIEDLMTSLEGEAGIYTRYLHNGGYEELLGEAFNKTTLKVSSCLADLDNDGIDELFLYLETGQSGVRGMEAYTFLLDIKSNQVYKVAETYFGGGSMGGSDLAIRFDRETQSHVLVLDGYTRDGVDACVTYMDVYSKPSFKVGKELNKSSYSLLNNYYKKEIGKVRSETTLYYEDEYNFRYYQIDGQYVTEEQFNNAWARYEDPKEDFRLKAGTYASPIS